MPKVRPGYVQLATIVTVEAMELLEKATAHTGRSISEEVDHALKRHGRKLPTVTVLTPELDDVTVEKRRAGRPRTRPRETPPGGPAPKGKPGRKRKAEGEA